jgi:hypothetical protein
MRGSYRKATTPSLTAATSHSDLPACPEAKRSDRPPSDAQIKFLADLMLRPRGERPEAVLDGHGRLSGRNTWVAIDARKAVRP